MDNTIQHHDELLEEHDEDICQIRQDLIDIKTRLGIKDLTNGQVVKYQEKLAQSLDDEREERKESDRLLREEIKSLDNKVWAIVVGIIIVILMNIAGFG